MKRYVAMLLFLVMIIGSAWAGSITNYSPLATPSDNAYSLWYDSAQPMGQRDRVIPLWVLRSVLASALTLAPTQVTQDSTHRFVTDAEKAAWDSTGGGVTSIGSGTPTTFANGTILGSTGTHVKAAVPGTDYLAPNSSGASLTGITAAQIGLGNVPNTDATSRANHTGTQPATTIVEDANHRFATDAEKTAWNAKQDVLAAGTDYLSPTGSGAGLTGITASQVGLGNVNNTSDANKPVSAATQSALDLKANLSGATFTGPVSAPSFTSSAADGTRFVQPYNSVAFSGTPAEGMMQTNSNGCQVYHNGEWVGCGGGVTSVTGTAPIVSSGGTTPAISISAATTSAAGSLSAADKTKLDWLSTLSTATCSGTLTAIAADTAAFQQITLSAACTTTAWTQPASGAKRITLLIVQGGSGSYTMAWPSGTKWPAGTAPTLTTAVGSVDAVSCLLTGSAVYCAAANDLK